MENTIQENQKLPTTINYYGTNLDTVGHYFFNLKGNSFGMRHYDFHLFPFNPEDCVRPYTGKGLIFTYEIQGYKILAISGSPADKRSGTKCVFFTKEDVSIEKMRDIIESIPIAKKIIESLPFEVHWERPKPK